MPLELLLLRHADALPRKGAMDDNERPLSSLGREQAQKVASYFLKSGIVPGRVVLSDAKRAQETWHILEKACGFSSDVEVKSRSDLYLASAGSLFNVIMHQGPVRPSPTLVIGHNPGLSLLAFALADDHDNAGEKAKLAGGLPPGGIAYLISKADNWAELRPGSAQFLDCRHP